jgi:Na+-transporting NADH:ubiquinone oxidoreductase subunit C
VANNDTVAKTVKVALALCIVCSVIVSAAAVLLKDAQVLNAELDKNRNILRVADMLEEGVPLEQQLQKVQARVVDLRTGRFTDDQDPASFDQRSSAKDPALSEALPSNRDTAKIRRREHYAVVYVVENEGEIEKVVLPIHGYGLWSTLYGFIALGEDVNTVVGLGFYEHKETPGLGGEVDNPRWKGLWPGKQLFNEGQLALEVIKGTVDNSRPGAVNQVDGIAGATLTVRGVNNLLQFWMGEDGFGPFLTNLKAGEA